MALGKDQRQVLEKEYCLAGWQREDGNFRRKINIKSPVSPVGFLFNRKDYAAKN